MNRFGWPLLKPVGRFCEPEENWAMQRKKMCRLPWRKSSNVKWPTAARPICSSLLPAVMESIGCLSSTIVHSSNWLLAPGYLTPFPKWFSSELPGRTSSPSGSLVSCGLLSGVRFDESLLLPWPQFVKRVVDIFASGCALLALSPLLLLIAVLIRLTGPGPLTFSHQRIGRGGQRFRALKFRSMVPNANQVLAGYLATHPELQDEWDRDHKLKNDPRVTWIGKIFLRKTSLDELPQLWNVFVGEMSLVGPRPIVDEEVAKYGSTFHDYLRVTPGITGLWQISGRNNTTYAERLAYDEFYVRSWSPWMDLYILIRTVRTVLFCEGAY